MRWRCGPEVDFTGWLGVGLQNQGRHIGLIYRLEPEAPAHFLHLAWHYQLLNEKLSEITARDVVWLTECALDEYSARYMAAFAAVVAECNGVEVPYGFRRSGLRFEEDGKLTVTAPGCGLTCATLVLQLFEDQRLPLLVEASWPRRESDRKFQQFVVDQLRAQGQVEHALAMEGDIGAVCRFLPTEVAAGLVSAVVPLHFDDAELLAGEILADIGGSISM